MSTKILFCALLFSLVLNPVFSQQSYFPDRHQWERKSPESLGMNPAKLQEAIEQAKANEINAPKDLNIYLNIRTNEPYNEMLGPVKERGPMTGIVVKNGYIVAEWGDIERVDMTFSVTKSFLSSVVGLAYDKGLIASVNDPVRKYSPYGHFDSDHNRKITWDHLLRQTSDWEGTLWGKPDWADRPQGRITEEVINRERHEPGTVYKYNDTRVNVLALAALHVWRKPLPQVLREELMDKIGASNTWRWEGYTTSWVEMDGQHMQSVSGGGHFGGGMFISALDQARFGYFTLRNGNWNGEQILSEEWMRMAKTPTKVQNDYGFMNFFLNTDQKRVPLAPESAFLHLGDGANVVYCDPENDLVIVLRWVSSGKIGETIGKFLEAME
jgi:CubicO group peptidase (beta-lactamase class C family)